MSEIAFSNFLFYFTSHFISQNCKLSTLEFEIISAKGKKSSGANSASAERGIVSTSTPSPPPSTGVGSGSGGHEASTSNEDYRVAFYGAGRVGKSSIIIRFIKNQFNPSYVPTIEDTYQQVITSNQKICMLQIIDTTGSHQFPAMQRLSFQKGNAFVLVYSITSKQSLEELSRVINTLKQVKGEALSECPIMLVGNKIDEDSKREISMEMGINFAKRMKLNCGFIETSAKSNANITELFQHLLSLEKKRHLTLSVAEIETKTTPKKKRAYCCIL